METLPLGQTPTGLKSGATPRKGHWARRLVFQTVPYLNMRQYLDFPGCASQIRQTARIIICRILFSRNAL
jgi:hypothetical protein